MSYRRVTLTSPRAMGNLQGLGGRQREACVLIKSGTVFVFSPRMLILCYLQASVTCSRQMPGVSRRSYSLFNRSHADCWGHVIADAVNHCRGGLLLLVPKYIILTWSFCNNEQTIDAFLFFTSTFCAFIMAILALKAKRPAVTIVILIA